MFITPPVFINTIRFLSSRHLHQPFLATLVGVIGGLLWAALFLSGHAIAQSATVIAQSATVIAQSATKGAQSATKGDQSAARTPDAGAVISLFNGRDLTGWTTWLQGVGTSDPEGVYSVKEGALRIGGVGMGYVATAHAYRDYHLSAEYRWGKKTDGSGYVRNSGILLHATGPEGNARGLWMASLECQLAQGCEGDLIVIEGKDAAGTPIPVTITSEIAVGSDGKPRWKPGGDRTVYSGKQFWWSRHQAGFEELVDTRGRDDVASPTGEWTRVECLCRGDEVTIRINGVTVNHCEAVRPQAGKILLENEGNEIYFRNIELRALKD